MFSFMSEEEVKKQSVVKVTNPILLDSVNRPTPGGLYDPAMGPFDDSATYVSSSPIGQLLSQFLFILSGISLCFCNFLNL